MRALIRISAGNRKVFQGFVSGYGFSHIETSATMTALAAAVAPDRRGAEFQIVTARMNACPSRNLLPHRPPTTHIRADFGKGPSLLVPIDPLLSSSRAGGSLRGKLCSRSRRSCKADSSEPKFLGMTKRKSGHNGTTKSRAPPVMSSPPPQNKNSHSRRFREGHD